MSSLILAATYRGHMIRTNRTNGFTWIERDGVCVATTLRRSDARRIVDDMLAWH